MADDDPDPARRKFLRLATCGVGGALGVAAAAPALSLIIAPARRDTVTSPSEPIDVGPAERAGQVWQRVDVIAPVVRDAWVSAQGVVLGAAYVRRAGEQVQALSAVCPHLGCAVGFDAARPAFLCPCHDSRFSAASGEVIDRAGPAKRGLDPLPIEVKDGRLRLTWIRYKLDTAAREPA
jgi:menaquinol-cytochrome c reductase iron-sulfur subunit